MPSNLLLLPLLAGFWFVARTHYFKFRTQSLDGYWLLLESSFVGVILGGLARVATVALSLTPVGGVMYRMWYALSPVPYSGTAVASLAGGVLASLLFNLACGAEKARNRAIERHGTDLDKLLNAALADERKVSLTLNSRKWYVGYVSRAPSLSPREAYVSISPVLSGFRSPETLEVEVTTDYVPALESEVGSRNFAVIIPLATIVSAAFFDDEIFIRFTGEDPHEEPSQGDLF